METTVTPIGTLEWDMKDGTNVFLWHLDELRPTVPEDKVCVLYRNYPLDRHVTLDEAIKEGYKIAMVLLANACVVELELAGVTGKIWICFSLRTEGWDDMLECNAYREKQSCELGQCNN